MVFITPHVAARCSDGHTSGSSGEIGAFSAGVCVCVSKRKSPCRVLHIVYFCVILLQSPSRSPHIPLYGADRGKPAVCQRQLGLVGAQGCDEMEVQVTSWCAKSLDCRCVHVVALHCSREATDDDVQRQRPYCSFCLVEV